MAGPQPIPYPEALDILCAKAREASKNIDHEMVSLDAALGRVVANDVLSEELLPTFANSAMDGFALRALDTALASETAPVKLQVAGHLAAGAEQVLTSRSGVETNAWEIMTGAPFPDGYDSCLRIEDAEIERNADGAVTAVTVRTPVLRRANRREIGEDFKAGAVVVRAGHRLRAEDILILASLGILRVPVRRNLRIGIISTGRELVPVTHKPPVGKIRNSSAPFLQAAMRARGCEPTILGTVPDEPSELSAILNGIKPGTFDLILTTGAISMGKHDFVPSTLGALETEFYFKKVAMRPGKPILFGRLKSGAFLIGLPGNPVSGAVGLRFFIDPFLRGLQGSPVEGSLRLPLDRKTRKTDGVTCFYKGELRVHNGASVVHLHDEQRPSLMHPLLTSSVWVRCPVLGDELAEGALVDVYPFTPGGVT